MSFIRIKKIGNKEYAYLVENRWYKKNFRGKGRGSRQKVISYLGKVYSFDKANDISFVEFKRINNEDYLNSKSKEQIIKDLIEWELFKHNAHGIAVDFKDKKILEGKKEVTLKINEGFLNSYTLGRLFNLSNIKSRESYYLAKCFVEAGIEIPQDIFVGMFGR